MSFPSIWVPGSLFILASCLIGKEAISSILLDQWCMLVNPDNARTEARTKSALN